MPRKVQVLHTTVQTMREDLIGQSLRLAQRRGVHTLELGPMSGADRSKSAAVLLADVVGEDAVVLAQPAIAGDERVVWGHLALVGLHDILERAAITDAAPRARVRGGEDGEDGRGLLPVRPHSAA